MNPQRILVVKLSAIGDVILATPVFSAIRERHPKAEITVLVGHEAAPLLENHPAISERWVIDQQIFWQKRMLALLRLWWVVRRRHFDQVYILHWSPLFHFYFWLAGIPERYGFAREGKAFGLTRAVSYTEAVAARHDVNQYLAVADPAFPVEGVVARAPRLFFTRSETDAIRQRLQEAGCPAGAAWIAVAPGGGNNPKLFMPQKRWPAASYADLVNLFLKERDRFIFLLGDRQDRDLLDPWADLPADRVRNWAGKLSLRETALVLQRCHLFIGNDSALLHLAGALGTPSLSFFGPTSPAGKTPDWTRHEVLCTQEACSPCYQYGQAPACPYELKCLYHITTEQAYKKACTILKADALLPHVGT